MVTIRHAFDPGETMDLEEPVALALRDLFEGQAEGLLASILNSLDYGVLVTDLDHTDLACNRKFGELFGINIRAVVENDATAVREMVRTRIPDFEAWSANLAEVYADPENEQLDEFRIIDPERYFRRHTGPVRDRSGKVVARLWTFHDQTSSRRLERMREVLHETSLAFDPQPKKIYQFITNKVAEYYGSVSVLSIRDGDYMSFAAIAGLPPGAPVGDGNPLTDAYCQFCIAQKEPIIIQDARLDPLASEVLPARYGVTRYAGVPLWTPDGSLIGTFCILDGRSNEILDEEDLRFLSFMAMRISSELERERQLSRLERDLAATQSQLIRSEKLAVTGTLAASIAHDIRNILSAISLTISMGQEDPAQTLSDLKGHLDRFEVLSHRLLVYARPKEVAKERVSISDVLKRVLDLLASHFRVSAINLDVKIDPDLPFVSADPSRLDHVFVNLILNGIQASSPSKSLRVRAFKKGRYVVVAIEDEGHGMSAEVRDRLFEPFANKRAQGFGLGLYSCRHIIAECGGKIQVESTPNVGTTFQVELPIL